MPVSPWAPWDPHSPQETHVIYKADGGHVYYNKPLIAIILLMYSCSHYTIFSKTWKSGEKKSGTGFPPIWQQFGKDLAMKKNMEKTHLAQFKKPPTGGLKLEIRFESALWLWSQLPGWKPKKSFLLLYLEY